MYSFCNKGCLIACHFHIKFSYNCHQIVDVKVGRLTIFYNDVKGTDVLVSVVTIIHFLWL